MAKPRRWDHLATATVRTDCAVISQEHWAQVREAEPYWDARKARIDTKILRTFLASMSHPQCLM